MKKKLLVITTSLVLALSFVSFAAAETSETIYEKENGVWTGVSNQYVKNDGVLTLRVKRVYNAKGVLEYKTDYEYVNGLYNGVSTQTIYDANGKVTKKIKRTFNGAGNLVNQVDYGYANGKWDLTTKETIYIDDDGYVFKSKVIKRVYRSSGVIKKQTEYSFLRNFENFVDDTKVIEYDTNGKIVLEVSGNKNRKVVKNYVNGKWDGIKIISGYEIETGEKVSRATEYYSGKGYKVSSVSYVKYNGVWKKTDESKFENSARNYQIWGRSTSYTYQEGKLRSEVEFDKIAEGNYQRKVVEYNQNGVVVLRATYNYSTAPANGKGSKCFKSVVYKYDDNGKKISGVETKFNDKQEAISSKNI